MKKMKNNNNNDDDDLASRVRVYIRNENSSTYSGIRNYTVRNAIQHARRRGLVITVDANLSTRVYTYAIY